MTIRLKRAYDKPAHTDGVRVLVERLWPRGLSKDAARIDWWPKDIAPSTELRRWYAHDVDKWPEFQRRYRAELQTQPELLTEIKKRARTEILTFVFAAHDTEHNSAVVLKQVVEGRRRATPASRTTKR